MSERNWKGDFRTLEKNIRTLFGEMTIGASGAISASSCRGFSIAQTDSEDGRYTVTLEDGYNSLRGFYVTLIGADDSAYGDAAGLTHIVRNVDVGQGTKVLYLQFVDPTDNSDADLPSGTEVLMEIRLKDSGLDY